MDYLIPVCQKRHGCEKVCGIIVPKGQDRVVRDGDVL